MPWTIGANTFMVSLQPGITGGGLSNIGLIARVWGKVTSSSTDLVGNLLVFIDDGSNVKGDALPGGSNEVGVLLTGDAALGACPSNAKVAYAKPAQTV